MKRILFIFPVALMLIMSSCSSTKFHADYDKSVDFSKFKTLEFYGWDKGSGFRLSQFDKERIEQAFAKEFRKRGIEIVPKKSGGDLIASLYIITQDKTSYTSTTVATGYYGYGGFYGYGPGWGWGPSMSMSTVHPVDYKVGTLICSVYDAKDKRLIWEGTISGTINEDPATRTANISKMVSYLMRKFPKKPVK